ncbi:MAG: UbiA family prenyltransferase [Candidatus Hadarchaeales archaeon]
MPRLGALGQLVRVDHDIMLAAGVVVGYAVSGGLVSPDYLKLGLAALTAFLVGASTFAMNDYFDLEIDRKNRRTDRPLVRGDINPRSALLLFAILFPAGLISSFFVNPQCFVVAALTGIIAVAYDVKVKRFKIAGNFYIAYMMAVPFIFGGVALSYVPTDTLVLALMAYLSGLGREVMKDVMDISGDREAGVRSFPTYIGERNALALSGLAYLAAVGLSPIPFFFGQNMFRANLMYALPVIAADVIFIYSAVSLFRENPDLKFHRRLTLAAMAMGLLGFMAGTLFRP